MTEDLSRREALKVISTGFPTVGLAPVLGQQAVPSTGVGSEPGKSDWLGKTLVLYTRSQGLSMPLIMTGCEFESPGGFLFLTGIDRSCSRSLVEWTEGVRRCVAWDAVESYLVFDSLDDYYGRLSDSRAEQTGAEPDVNGPMIANATESD